MKYRFYLPSSATLDQNAWKKSSRRIQNTKLEFATCCGNYLHNFDMVLGIISNLERIKSIQEDAHRLYAKYYVI